MNLWRRVLQALGLIRKPERRVFALDESLAFSVERLAEREQRPADEMAARLLTRALQDQQAAEDALADWHCLTPRERQVAALICLGLTSRQIATELHLSPNTVKSHAANILLKFGVPSRAALRQALEGWDFEAWLGGNIHE